MGDGNSTRQGSGTQLQRKLQSYFQGYDLIITLTCISQSLQSQGRRALWRSADNPIMHKFSKSDTRIHIHARLPLILCGDENENLDRAVPTPNVMTIAELFLRPFFYNP